MSVLVTDLIDRAGLKLADPNFRRTSRDEFLSYYNEIQRKVAIETRCLEVDADFDVKNGVFQYPYPATAVGVSGVRYSETPPDGFYWLHEMFRDEWRATVNRLRPSGNVWAYHARPSSYELIGTPTVDVTGGGILTYFVKPASVLSESGQSLEVPELLEDLVVEGMVIRARLTGRDRVAARQDLELWLASLAAMREQIEDRSDDRRPALRAEGALNPYGGMV